MGEWWDSTPTLIMHNFSRHDQGYIGPGAGVKPNIIKATITAENGQMMRWEKNTFVWIVGEKKTLLFEKSLLTRFLRVAVPKNGGQTISRSRNPKNIL